MKTKPEPSDPLIAEINRLNGRLTALEAATEGRLDRLEAKLGALQSSPQPNQNYVKPNP